MEQFVDLTFDDAMYLIEYDFDESMIEYFEQDVFDGVDNSDWNAEQMTRFFNENFPGVNYRIVPGPGTMFPTVEYAKSQEVEKEEEKIFPGMAAAGYRPTDLNKKFLDKQIEYVKNNWQFAVNAGAKFGFDAIAQLAQGATECDYGKTDRATKSNNFFNIKKGSISSNEYWDGELNGPFRKYKTTQNCFYDHGLLLSNLYKEELQAAKTNHEEFATKIAYSRYIVDSDGRPDYERNIKSIYKTIYTIATQLGLLNIS